MKITEPYSPTPRAKASAKPVSSAGDSGGSDHAPKRLRAGRAERRGGFLEFELESASTGCTVRTTNGRPTKTSATRMPSGVKAILMPSVASGAPSQPFGA